MEQVHVIRHKAFAEGLSIRQIARDLGVSRNTVRRYLRGAEGGVGKKRERPTPVLDRVRSRIDKLLEADEKSGTKKQRLTAARVHELLVEEQFEVGTTTVKEYVREWRRQRQEVFVPLVYPPGDSAQVDFFEVVADIAGVRTKAWMFVMRLMFSGRDFAWLYPRQDQICFLDGHVRAFRHFGAVPQRIVYDNLKAAVAKQLVGSERKLSARFDALSRHYLFEPCFARPYTGHDKGGVESRGRAIRLRHLVPIPRAEALATVSAQLLGRLDARFDTEKFAQDASAMLAVADRPFRSSKLSCAKVSRRALVKAEGASYSVWSRWASLDVEVFIGPEVVEIVGPDDRLSHPRKRFGERSVDYRHYLAELAKKPQAVRQVSSELVRDLGAPYDAVWRRLVNNHGPKQAARVFAKVLAALVDIGHDEVVKRLARAESERIPVLIALRGKAPKPRVLDKGQLPLALADIKVSAGKAVDYNALLGTVH